MILKKSVSTFMMTDFQFNFPKIILEKFAQIRLCSNKTFGRLNNDNSIHRKEKNIRNPFANSL